MFYKTKMTGTTNNGLDFIGRLRKIVESNFQNEQFGVSELAREIGMSRSFIHRHIKKQTNQSISYFIRKVRLEKALEMLLQTDEPASEISFRVGFSSPAYFNHCFHEHYGFPPGEARKSLITISESETTSGNSEQEYGQNQINNTSQEIRKTSKKNYIYFLITAILLLALFAFPLYFLFLKGTTKQQQLSASEKSVVVLPFKNLSSDIDNQYFADGITEDILNRLSTITGLKVVSRTSAEQFRESALSARQISRQLKVNFLLEGSVRRFDDQVRITVQFIDARNDRHIWSKNYDRQMKEIFNIQTEIAMNVANELHFVLTPEEKKLIEKNPTINTEAYNYYLMGRYFWNKRTEEALCKSVECFEKAIVSDREYALAYAGLADAYFILTWWRWESRPDGYEKAKKTAIRALELDKNLAEAHATLGSILCYHDWNWEQSREVLLKAIQLNPGYATAHQYYSELLEILCENELARQHINISVELDPMVFMHRLLSFAYLNREGKNVEAMESLKFLEEIYPEYRDLKYYSFHLYGKQGERAKAMEMFREILQRDYPAVQYDDIVKNELPETEFREIFMWLIEQQKQKPRVNPYSIAKWHVFVGEKENALTWLEKAFEDRLPGIPRINCDIDFDIIRNEPRFLALIEKMGLTPYSNRLSVNERATKL